MNNDYLRLNSKVDDSEIVTGEFKSKPVQKKNKKENKKVTLLTLLNYSRKNDPTSNIQSLNTPNIRTNFTLFFIVIFVTVLLCFLAFLTNDITILIFTTGISSFLYPLFLISFTYQIDKTHGVSFIEIIVGFVLGIGVYISVKFFDNYLNEIVKYIWIHDLVSVVLNDVALFIFASLFVKIAKKDNMFDVLLLVVALYAGYMFINSFYSLIESMLISVQINFGNEVTSTGAIILGESSFKAVITNYLNALVVDILYLSAIMSCNAIVNGGVIGLSISPIKDETYKEWSFYVLFLLTIILHVASVFPTSIRIFEIILRTIGLIFSFILAITILNYYVSKSYSNKKSE